ncbi:MAG: ABC transporter permease [Candidatus Riflebacteria bacterium]|nr:ABC transporter permease [Candidatus Riflebacteria bacterium]
MPPSLFLAIQGLRFRRRQAAITVLGVFVGVLALIVILAILNGFERSLIDQILETSGHVQVYSKSHQIDGWPKQLESIRALPAVKACAPAILAQGMIENEKEQAFSGASIKGIVPDLERHVNQLASSIVKGEFRFYSQKEVLLGEEMARQLKVKLNDQVNLVIPDGSVFELRVVGIFRTGVTEFDFQTMMVPLELTQAAFGFKSGCSHLFVKTEDPLAARELAARIKGATGLEAASWLETNRVLLQAISLEQQATFLVILLTLIVASFGISNVLTMMVIEKFRDIGILRSLGATRRQIVFIFLIQGTLIGLLGTVLGCAGGYAVGLLLQTYPIQLPTAIYAVGKVPVLFDPLDFVKVSLLTLVISLGASFFPARKAIALEPMEAIRYYA